MRILAVLSLALGISAFAGAPDVVACDDSDASASSASASRSEGERVADVRVEPKGESTRSENTKGENTTVRKADDQSVALNASATPDCK